MNNIKQIIQESFSHLYDTITKSFELEINKSVFNFFFLSFHSHSIVIRFSLCSTRHTTLLAALCLDVLLWFSTKTPIDDSIFYEMYFILHTHILFLYPL